MALHASTGLSPVCGEAARDGAYTRTKYWNVCVKAKPAVPEVLVKHNLAFVVEADMSDAEGVANDFLAQRRKPRLHGPNQINVATVLQRLMHFYGDSSAGFAEPAKVVYHSLFISGDHQRIAKVEIKGVQ